MTRYPIKTATSIFIYWLFVSLIPIYNKFFFRKERYPYPIATAGIQLGVVALLLGGWNAIEHKLKGSSTSSTSSSWVGGPHLLWKIQWCAPIGILFGLKYGVTNLGLHLVPAPTHLLLQATDLVWTVLSAYVINRERLNIIELLCLVCCIAGSFVLSWNQLHNQDHDNNAHEHHSAGVDAASPGLFAIFINLLSPMLLGLCIATLRLACCELMRPNNRVDGTVSAVELTTIKLVISSSVALLLACMFERGDTADDGSSFAAHHFHYTSYDDSWWQAFGDLPWSVKVGVMGGAILIAIFQVNCTFLTYLTSAVSVGLVGQVKIIPQWIAAAIFAKLTSDFTIQGPNLVGAFLIMVSAATFAGSKFYIAKQQNHYNLEAGRGDDSTSSSTGPTSDVEDGGVPLLLGSGSEDEGDDNPLVTNEKTALLLVQVENPPPNHIPCDGNIPVLSDGDQWSTGVIRANYDSIVRGAGEEQEEEDPSSIKKKLLV